MFKLPKKTLKQWIAICVSMLLTILTILMFYLIVYYYKKDNIEIEVGLGVLMISTIPGTILIGIAYNFLQYFKS